MYERQFHGLKESEDWNSISINLRMSESVLKSECDFKALEKEII